VNTDQEKGPDTFFVRKRYPAPFFSVLLISAAAIAYEILLIRILSIVQWHHFAWMIISLALLGYGASGTAIALARRWLEPRFEPAFAASALLFSVSMVLCLVLGQRVPFNALEVIWDPAQTLYLGALYLLFMLPFFFAAACIGLAFTCRGERVDRIYFFDLLGAGVGAALVIGVLFLLPPQQAVIAFSGLALAASALAHTRALTLSFAQRPPRKERWPRIMALLQIAWLFGLVYAGSADRIGLRMSEFKGLSQALEVVDARVVAERSGPLGLLTVVASPRVPFRHAPGLSFTTQHLPPAQLALFTDGDGISVITAFDGDAAELGFLGDVTAALPYRLFDPASGGPRVLVLGAGAGYDVLLALHNGASRIDAVELNPQVAELMRGELAAWSGNLYEHERVTLHVSEARGYVSRGRDSYDLVQVALLDSAAVAGSGAQALSESYLYTVEATGVYLDRLKPDGLLAVTRWLKIPPRDNLKMAATVIEALRRSGVQDPGRRLAMIRGWNTVTLLAKNGDFSERDTAAVRQFARERSFDVVWYPVMPPGEANRFNRLDRPWLYEGVVALLGERSQAYIDEYKFDISPATDQRPYFFDFFRWRALPEVLDLRLRGGAGLLEWGYLLLVATLLQALAAGALLILLPLTLTLALSRRRAAAATPLQRPSVARGRFGAYFFLLGLAFLFVEIAFIQKFILFLAHPLYAVAVVLAGFLVFAGLGSASSQWLACRLPGGARDAVPLAVALLAAIVMLYLALLPLLFEWLIGGGDAVRVAASLALIAPLAFCMGMPFPLGLRRLAAEAPDFIPWAWALNGFASVVSAALATLLAIEFGFNAVLLAALGCYGAAAVLFRR
jgi:spermidine synthase